VKPNDWLKVETADGKIGLVPLTYMKIELPTLENPAVLDLVTFLYKHF
jgi:hypothetical protein